MSDITDKLNTAVSKVQKSDNIDMIKKHGTEAVKYTVKGLKKFAHENPKISTALVAGAAGLALGKKLSRRKM